MSRRFTLPRRIGLAFTIVAFANVVAAGGSVDIVTSPEHADVALDRTSIRAIFSARLRQWPDGSPIRVFVLPDSEPVHAQFCREQLGTFPYVLRAAWDRLVYTGTGLAPEVVSNEREMRVRLAATRGAIGYVSTASIPGVVQPAVVQNPPVSGEAR
ncbi:hypothetical protein B1810_20815 [Panacagrimonas perspica]|uniref:hypothetical protein n=1 Tax=Panacagrimonas perspica TaxID=381431 RepID=UPI00105D90B0|nr:hypothetical protein [Panacagrimonas perspica]THD01189.1 hypothetical protein B1810_20815 [Panacagrimonas perspica]